MKDCDSDGESRDMSERSAISPPLVPTKRGSGMESQTGSNDKMVSLSPLSTQKTTSNSIYSSSMNTNEKPNVKEELRTSSIAALRAKALEHCAKVNQIATKPNDSTNSGLFATNRSVSHHESISPTTHFNHSSPTRHHIF